MNSQILFIRLFYLFLSIIVYWNGYDIFTVQHEPNKMVWLLTPIPADHWVKIAVLLFFSSLASCFYQVLRPSSYSGRVLVTLLILSFFSIRFSFGKIDHPYHSWILASLIFPLYSSKEILISRNTLILRVIQYIHLFQYFAAGLWKFYAVLFIGSNTTNGLLDMISYSIAEGSSHSSQLALFLHNWPMATNVLVFILITFQLSTIIPFIYQRLITAWGLFCIFFHSVTGIAVGIWYEGAVLALIFFFIVPTILEHSEEFYSEN